MSHHLLMMVTVKMMPRMHAIARNSIGRVLMIVILGSGGIVRKLAESVVRHQGKSRSFATYICDLIF